MANTDPFEAGMSQDQHDAFMQSILQKAKPQGKASPAQTMDAVELGLLAQENALEIDPDGAEGALLDTFLNTLEAYKKGNNGREENQSVIETAAQLDGQTAINALDHTLNTPMATVPEKVAAAQVVSQVQKDTNRMFTDPVAGKHAHRKNELAKALDTDEGRGATGREGWDTNKRMSWFGDLTEEEQSRAWQGFVDGVVGEAMFLSEIMLAGAKDLVTLDTDFPNVKEMLTDAAMWDAYIADQRAKDPNGYGEGVGPGRVTGAVLSPADLGALHVAGVTVKSAVSVTSGLRTSRQLTKAIGGMETMKVAKASETGLVKMIREGDEVLEKALIEQVGKKNPLSKKIEAAVVRAKGDEIIAQEAVLANSSPMANIVKEATAAEDHDAIDAAKYSVMLANQPTSGEIKAALDAGEATPLTLVGTTHSGIAAPSTDIGVKLNNAAAVEPVAEALKYDVLTRRQSLVEGIQSLHIKQVEKDLNELNMGVSAESWKGKARGATIRMTMPGTAKFKGSAKKEIVDNVTVNSQLTRVLKRSNGDMWNAVWKGLNKHDTQALNEMAHAANEAESWGQIVDGIYTIANDAGEVIYRNAASPQALDAFVARKRMMQNTKDTIDGVLRSQARRSGVKLYNGQHLARELKSVEVGEEVFDLAGNPMRYTTDMEQQGYRVAKVDGIEDETFLVAMTREHWDSKLKEIPNDYEMVETINGYMRQEYKDKFRVLEVNKPDDLVGQVDPETGIPIGRGEPVSPVATADTMYEANLLIDKARAEGKLMIAMRAEPGQAEAAYSNEFMSSFIRMSEDQLDDMFESMRRAGYPDEALKSLRQIHNKYGKFNPAFKSASALKARGPEPLKKVLADGTLGEPSLRVAKEADAIYMDWAANYVGNVPYMEELIEQFLTSYGNHLTKPADFLSPLLKGVEPKLADEIRAFQNQLRLMTGRKSDKLAVADKRIMSVADRMLASKNPMTRKLGNVVDDELKLSGLIQTASNLTTQSKLGMGSLVQLGLQASFGVLSGTGASLGRMAGKNFFPEAVALVKGYDDFIKSLGPRIFKGANFTKSGTEAHQFLERWGILDGIDWDGMARELSNIRKQRGMAKKVADRALKVTATPFVEGEKLNQVFGVLLSRRVIAEEIKAGRHPFLKAKDLANGGSARFGEEVILRGKTLSLNMARHNAPGFSQNEFLALALKFKEFVSHGTNLYLDPILAKNLSKREAIGIWATSAAVLGPKGIPMLWDALAFSEGTMNTLASATGNVPEYTGMLTQDMWVDGAAHIEEITGIPADKTFKWMTQGGNAFANRMMMASVFSDYVEGAGNDEVVLGPVYATVKNMLKDGVVTGDQFLSMLRRGDVDFEALALSASEQFVGPNNAARFIESQGKGRVLSRSGKTLISEPSLKESLLLAAGITPIEVTTAYDTRSLSFRKKKVIDEWIKGKIKTVNQLYQINSEQGDAEIDRIERQLNEVDVAYAKAFLKGMVTAIGDNALDVQTKTFLDQITSGAVESETARILGLEPQ